jgi:AraC-like DNA-binding protein
MKQDTIPTLSAKSFAEKNYLQVSQSDYPSKANLEVFELHRIEEHKEFIRFPLLPHKKTVHDFIFLTKGEVVRSKGLDKYAVRENQVFFLPAYNITSTDFVSRDALGYYCHFSQDFLNNKTLQEASFFDFDTPPVLVLEINFSKFLAQLLQHLLANAANLKTEVVTKYLQAVLAELRENLAPAKAKNYDAAHAIFANFKNELLKKIYDVQTVAGFAELLHVSPNHLNKCTKSVTGRTAQDWINEMIILEAKVLLRQTGKPISEIALGLTGQDASDFGRFFRKKTGYTPTNFRKLD